MINIYIYGRGLGLGYVKRCLNEDVSIQAYIDNFTIDTIEEDGRPILHKEDIDDSCDFIVISIMLYEEIRKDLIESGIEHKKIICFFSMEDAENDLFYSVFDSHKWKMELIWKYQNDVVIPTMNNLYYENNEEMLLSSHAIPHIIDVNKTIDLIINEHKSLTRFGDGEFEIMLNRARPRFQSVDGLLKKRLEEIIRDDIPALLLALANNYGNLSSYTDDAANGIRSYLTPSVRQDHMRYLNMQRVYYDAYLSRPYIMYRNKDKNVMRGKFDHLKKIWEGQDILIVEGYHTRFGVGNDLISNASNIVRILAPDKNAFSVYDDILDKTELYGKDRLILATLGPTATVLSYDLAKRGYWAVDIGQADTEYEWFLRGTTKRCDVPYKTVSEYAVKSFFFDIDEPFKSEYEKQIVCQINLNRGCSIE